MLYLNLLRASVDLVAELPMEFLRVDTCSACGLWIMRVICVITKGFIEHSLEH